MNSIQRNTGIISAITIIALTLTFLVTIIVFPLIDFISTKDYVSNYKASSLIPVIPSFLLTLANIPLFIVLFYYAAKKRRIFALTGIVFGAGYMITSSINYFLQLSAVNKGIVANSTEFITPFLFYNPMSVTYAIDNLGYLFLSVSFLFFSGIFNQRGLQSWIKSFFIVTGISGIIGCLGYLLNNSLLETLVFITAFPYLISVALLIFEFRKKHA